MIDHTWIKQAAKLYENGMSYKDIASVVRHSRKTVSFQLRKLGYKSNPKYVRNINPEKLAKYDYSYASHIFDKIDTEEKAYWLGFLYADGSMDETKCCVSLALKEEDKSTVEKFRDFLHLSNKPLHRKIRVLNTREYVSYEFAAYNRALFLKLVECGCPVSKTFKLKFPSDDIVPLHLTQHFIRGYFDGDGTVSHGGRGSSRISIEILGTSDFLEGYQKWTRIPHKLYTFNHSTIFRSIYGGANAIVILDRLYDGATIYMPRKYEKYLHLRRFAVTSSKRTAKQLAGKIGEGLAANTEVTSEMKHCNA